MWNGLDKETKGMSALVVHPFDHGGKGDSQPINFENGFVHLAFESYYVRWMDSVRGKCPAPFEKGKVTYYKLFDNGWNTDEFYSSKEAKRITLGEGRVSYKYNPYAPATFKGGLSTNFGGAQWQDEPNSRYDILSFFTPEFEEDTTISGKIRAKLRVKSDREDTCFYVRLSLCKEEGYYGLRDDINQISNFNPDYKPGEEIDMEFTFDEHAFVVHKGEKIRIDVSSSAFPHYVPHTNCKGNFALQTTAKIAHNTIILDKSSITL
jgi:predicted acyl esterase